MIKNKYFFALVTVIIYEILMLTINPTGFSFLKVSITLFVWISVVLSIITFYSKYRTLKTKLPGFAVKILILLLSWNIINIIRSIVNGDGVISTLLGNSFTALALLLPLSIAFCYDKINLRIINNFLFNLIIIGLIYYFALFLTDQTTDIIFNKSVLLLLYCSTFLITISPFQFRKKKVLIILSSIVLFYLALKTGNRTMMGRIPLLFLAGIAIYIYRVFKFRWILHISILSLFIPFYILQVSLDNNQSLIGQYLSGLHDKQLSTDTRTFLYAEIFKDLSATKTIIAGKGANGKYYSAYFHGNKADTDKRLTVEVGILAILLKGGVIAVILNLLLLFTAIFYAFYRSNNYYIVGIGFVLLIHTMLLFIENVVNYSVYNVAIWFFIGICLSGEIRNLSNTEIKCLLQYRTNPDPVLNKTQKINYPLNQLEY